jgi:hypothetical protein
MGEHLWFANRARPASGTIQNPGEKQIGAVGSDPKAEVRRHLWAGFAVDVLEICVLGYVCARGDLAARAALLGGGGSLAFAGLGVLALRNF